MPSDRFSTATPSSASSDVTAFASQLEEVDQVYQLEAIDKAAPKFGYQFAEVTKALLRRKTQDRISNTNTLLGISYNVKRTKGTSSAGSRRCVTIDEDPGPQGSGRRATFTDSEGNAMSFPYSVLEEHVPRYKRSHEWTEAHSEATGWGLYRNPNFLAWFEGVVAPKIQGDKRKGAA